MGEKFCELQTIKFWENFIHECLIIVDKDRAIALIRVNIIRKILHLARSRNFLLRKFPVIRYVCSRCCVV